MEGKKNIIDRTFSDAIAPNIQTVQPPEILAPAQYHTSRDGPTAVCQQYLVGFLTI